MWLSCAGDVIGFTVATRPEPSVGMCRSPRCTALEAAHFAVELTAYSFVDRINAQPTVSIKQIKK
jgi:hypothetical protein